MSEVVSTRLTSIPDGIDRFTGIRIAIRFQVASLKNPSKEGVGPGKIRSSRDLDS